MEFKGPYLMAMRERAPKMFMELRRSGQMDQHLQEMSLKAHAMLEEMLADAPRGATDLPPPHLTREAEEIVRATLIEFPPPDDPTAPSQ